MLCVAAIELPHLSRSIDTDVPIYVIYISNGADWPHRLLAGYLLEDTTTRSCHLTYLLLCMMGLMVSVIIWVLIHLQCEGIVTVVCQFKWSQVISKVIRMHK